MNNAKHILRYYYTLAHLNTDNEKTLQSTIIKMIRFTKNNGRLLMALFGCNPFKEFSEYGIVTKAHIKNLVSQQWFNISQTNSIRTILNNDHHHGVDHYYLLGIWYHHPTNNVLDVHRLTVRDINNLAKLIISDLTNNFALSKAVFVNNKPKGVVTK